MCRSRISQCYISEASVSTAECYGVKMVMMVSIGFPQKKQGQVSRRSVTVYWMAGILVVDHRHCGNTSRLIHFGASYSM